MRNAELTEIEALRLEVHRLQKQVTELLDWRSAVIGVPRETDRHRRIREATEFDRGSVLVYVTKDLNRHGR